MLTSQVSLLAALAASASCTAATLPSPLTPAAENGLRPTRTRSAPKEKRSDIDSDAVVGFVTTVPDNTEGELMEKWWPYLYVVDGCVPFPAVDAEGNTK